MEEVDNIILNSLRECGCDFAEDLTSLAALSTENVVEATVRCLRVIDPQLNMSHSLPPGMSARFRIGTVLAQACQSAGYKSDVGYQTFLYSSETDIRRLFMFLVEKLPRKKDEGMEQPSGKESVLTRNIARVLKDQLNHIWLPPYCKKQGVRWSGGEFFVEGARGTTPYATEPLIIPDLSTDVNEGILEYYRDRLPFVHQQVEEHSRLTPSLLQHNSSELSREQDWETEWNSTGVSARISLQEYKKRKLEKVEKLAAELTSNRKENRGENEGRFIGGISSESSFAEVVSLIAEQMIKSDNLDLTLTPSDKFPVAKERLGAKKLLINNRKIPLKKPPIPKKPTLKVLENHVNGPIEDGEPEMILPEETEVEKMERVERELREEVDQIVERLEKMEVDVDNYQEGISQAKQNLLSCQEANKTVQEKVKLQKKTLSLLPNAEENISKLQAMVEANQKRMVSLSQQWDKHRIPLLEKYEELKESSSKRQTQSERKLEEIKLVRQRIKENTEEMKRKEQMEKQLTAEYGEMTRDVSRKSYTKKIFEIVANIRKQKQQIERALCDMRTLQKEINQLQGRVERTFTAADDLIFSDAKSDTSVRQAYKYLAGLNANCAQLLTTVEDTGSVMREIRDLEEQIANESKQNTTENLKKITADFKEMKKENNEMVKKLKSMSSPTPKARKSKS